MTKDSGWVVGAIVLHFAWAVILLGLSVFLLSLTRSSAILSEKNAADAVAGLRIAALILLPPSLLVFASWFGLWKRKLWGWWLALTSDSSIFGLLLYSTLDDGWRNPDWDAVGLAVAAAVPLVFLFLPTVRRTYRPSGVLDDASGAVRSDAT